MNRLLALDFDGVISDSAPEAFAVALRTYAELEPAASFADRARAAGPGAPPPGAIAEDPHYMGFLDTMALGNRAEDYAVVLSALESGTSLPDQARYDAYRADLDPGWLRTFHRRFYEVRHTLASADPEGWRALLGPYPRFCDILRRRAADVLLAIATAKDRRSVRMLLRGYGIDALFGEDRILDKETGVSKRSHLEHLRRTTGVEFADMTFLDDKVNHLADVAPLGVRCALAAWGYNGTREADVARARGYLICTLDDAEAVLFA